MPDTIVDKDNEQPEENHSNRVHIEQVESKEERPHEDNEDEDMPPTIKEDEEPINRIKPTKTMVNPPKNPIIEEKRLYKSGPLPADSSKRSEASQNKPIEDFMDLFGMSGGVSSFGTALKHKASEPVSQLKDLSLVQMSSSVKFVSLPEKQPSSDLNRREESGEEESKHRVHFVGFKPTAAHREFLKKQHLEIVSSPDAEYSILLVKQPLRICNRLLLALIQGKRIETEQWIFNKQAEIQSKLNNYSWKQIY